ncbi:unnamed protein product, partial [Aphanomyces euteiches]
SRNGHILRHCFLMVVALQLARSSVIWTWLLALKKLQPRAKKAFIKAVLQSLLSRLLSNSVVCSLLRISRTIRRHSLTRSRSRLVALI